MAPVKSQLRDGSLQVIVGIVTGSRGWQNRLGKIFSDDIRILFFKFNIRVDPLPFQLEGGYIKMAVMEPAPETGEKVVHQPPVGMDAVTCQERPLPFVRCRGTDNRIYIGGKLIVCFGKIYSQFRATCNNQVREILLDPGARFFTHRQPDGQYYIIYLRNNASQ